MKLVTLFRVSPGVLLRDSQFLDLISSFTLNQWHEIYNHADFEPKIRTVIRASAFKCKFVL